MLLEQHLSEPSVVQLKHKRKMNRRYVKKVRRMCVDQIIIAYFVRVAWGLSTGFLFKFKKRAQSKQQSTATNLVGEAVLIILLIQK